MKERGIITSNISLRKINNLKKTASSQTNFSMWLLIGKTSHTILSVWQKELAKYPIPVRQLHVLRTIDTLGPNATLANVAKEVDRELHVISKQTISMERDGLIRRIKNKPKSTLLTLELTEKGIDIVNSTVESQSIDKILSSLTGDEYKQLEATLNKLINVAEEYEAD